MSRSAYRASPGSRVLIIDDDSAVRVVVRLALEQIGCVVAEADSGEAGLAAFTNDRPDAVILDLGLPQLPGLEVLARLRDIADVPVLLLTSRNGESDRILGLELGADDYIAKPFSPGELGARLEATLRRSSRNQGAAVLEFDGLVIDSASRELRLDGETVRLTTREFELLRFLAESPRQVFTKAQLLHHVWNSSSGWQTEATVSEHVHRLRAKIERDPKRPERIITIRGGGYRFDP